MGKNKLLGAAAAALATMTVGAVITTDAHAQASTSWSGAPRTREEDREFKMNGRVHYDIFSIDQDFANPATPDVSYTGSFARRVFIGAEGRFTQNWRYNIKVDLAPSASNNLDEVRLDDAFLEYAADSFSLFIGQHNAVSHLEDRTSSNYTPFNERSMIDQAFGFGKIFGIGFLTNGGNWSAGVSLHGDTLNNAQTVGVNESSFVIGRVTWAPIYQRTPEGTTVLHLGALARHRDDGSSNTFSYSARPAQNSLTGLGSTVSSGGAHDSDDLLGAEFAFIHNAFGVSAEYMTLDATPAASNLSDRTVDGGYVDIFWSPTGESRNYVASDGSWGRINPRRTLGSDGGIGHIMLTARYEWLDVSDNGFGVGAANRGEQTGYLAGITWQPIGYVKFQFNYGNYELDRPGTANDQDIETMSFRTQLDF